MILDDLKNFTNTYKNFEKYVFISICKKNKKSFLKFLKLPESTIIFYIIEYLENKNVPIEDAISFYSYKFKGTFKDKTKFMIKNEFYRIEHNKKTNYLPF